MAWIYLIAFIFTLYFTNRWIRSDKKFESIPGPQGHYIIENAIDFLMDPDEVACKKIVTYGHWLIMHEEAHSKLKAYFAIINVQVFYYIRELAITYKDIFRVKLGPRKIIVVCNPEDTEAIISTTKYNGKGLLYGFLEPWLKEGLLVSDGAKWHQRRKILTPTFHFNILRHFNTVLEENSQKLVEQLATEVGKDKTDVSIVITDFTLHSICETAMGTKLDKETSSAGRNYKDAIFKLGEYLVYRAQRVWLYPDLVFSYTDIGQKQQKVLDLLKSFRDSVIDKRRESSEYKNILLEASNSNDEEILLSGKRRLAMLDLLLQAEREGVIDAAGIGEEVDTFMFEGHDTTSTALQFTLMLLANYPDVQDKIVEECNQIFSSSDHQANTADLAKMKYLECCIKESLRLYPPVHFIMRKLWEPLKFKSGHEVPAGTDCAILIWDLHRRSDQYVDPEQFRPERFMADKPTWHPYAFIPFSAGPRNCIGQKFAMNEMKFALTAILRNYKLLPVTTPKSVVFIMDMILRPVNPIHVKFEKRC